MTDKTLIDIGRRELNFHRDLVAEVLPEHYLEEYPQLVTLLEKYYNDLNKTDGVSNKIKGLFRSRDIQQTPAELLTYNESELLLGENYIEGWLNKRQSALMSNQYYRSKGTLYSYQRFFRAFYGIDPVVEYGKDYVFTVGQDTIGPTSGKYIINDKIFQFWGVLIKVGIPLTEWKDLFKLFVHPAGMYVGAEIQVVSVNGNISFDYMPNWFYADIAAQYVGIAQAEPFGATDITGMGISESDGSLYRFSLDNTIGKISSLYPTAPDLLPYYQNIGGITISKSPTFDDDSDATGSVIKLSNTLEVMDKVDYTRYDSD